MTDPLASDPQITRMARYVALPTRELARVTVAFLKRTGAFEPGMEPRRLTITEAEQLTDEDFAQPEEAE